MLFGYARVSTDDQKLDLQHDSLVHAGVDRERIFEDKLSGMRADRPGLASVLKAVREGDVLVIWRLDRLGRSLKELIAMADELKRKGVQLRSVTEGIDTTTIGGELLFHLFGAIAQFERNLIRERTRAGLAECQGKGEGRGQTACHEGEGHRYGKGFAQRPGDYRQGSCWSAGCSCWYALPSPSGRAVCHRSKDHHGGRVGEANDDSGCPRR
jgi:DNA invertase Pin-like site-specific DNA recombinase